MGDLVFLLAAIYGLSYIAEALGTFFVVVKYLGGAYLIWLGMRMLLSREEKNESHEAGEPPRLMSVAVQSSDANLLVGDRAPIMSWPYRMFGTKRSWDAADDGRFLAIKTGASETAAAQIAVVQNWFQELERFVPTD